MSAQDITPRHPPDPTAPYANGAAVVPSDTTDLTFVTRAVWVGGVGNVSVIMQNGTTVIFNAVAAGTLLLIRCRRVTALNTTATNMVALW